MKKYWTNWMINLIINFNKNNPKTSTRLTPAMKIVKNREYNLHDFETQPLFFIWRILTKNIFCIVGMFIFYYYWTKNNTIISIFSCSDQRCFRPFLQNASAYQMLTSPFRSQNFGFLVFYGKEYNKTCYFSKKHWILHSIVNV